MKSYPTKLDNPYLVRVVANKNTWGIYRRDPYQKLAEFGSEFEAYSARRALIDFENDQT